jgi:hypothetical protein
MSFDVFQQVFRNIRETIGCYRARCYDFRFQFSQHLCIDFRHAPKKNNCFLGFLLLFGRRHKIELFGAVAVRTCIY